MESRKSQEYDGLDGLETFVEINEEEYLEIRKEHSNAAMAIPTMIIFTVKKDKEGNPVQAKSYIVVLGNLKQRIWKKLDQYAPCHTLGILNTRTLATRCRGLDSIQIVS